MPSPSTSNAVTTGQHELLAFFGKPAPDSKRAASIIISGLLGDPLNARRWLIERARRYVANMEPPRRAPDDPQDSHTVVFNATRALLHGFNLMQEEARALLTDYCSRSDMPWTAAEIAHKLHSVDAQQSKFPRGYLVRDFPTMPNAATRQAAGVMPKTEVVKKVEFDAEKLKASAQEWRDTADLVWLANRSAADPATVTAAGFLELLYAKGEHVLIFTDYFSQGQAIWPKDPVPTTGALGVWFLPAPVDGQYHPNPRSLDRQGNARMSRRSEESVTCYRYLLLESDKADLCDWLGFIVQAPLCIEAIYTSGGRSIHALVRVDCRTKPEWEDVKRGLMPFLMGCVMVGGDRGVLSGVRLSRLPGCFREGKEDDQGRYTRFPKPKPQKLLYVRPEADDRPICELPPMRDVERTWCEAGARVVDGFGDTAEIERVTDGLAYYANVSAACKTALEDLL